MNKITDLIEDAWNRDDYKFRINFLVAGLISEKSNDTQEKMELNKNHLIDIKEYMEHVTGPEEKQEYALDMVDRIKEYLEIFG